MKKAKFKSAVAGGVALAFAGAGLAALAAPAYAISPPQTAPAWEADAAAAAPYGNVLFYDAQGHEVTSGTGDLANAFSFAVGATALDTGATKASLGFAQVEPPPATPATWSVGAASGTTTFTTLTAANTPASVFSYNGTNPIVSLGTTGANIQSFSTSFPSSATTGYVNTIEVRLTDSGASGGNAPGTYWESDIGYNTTGTAITLDGTTIPANGWALLFPFTNPTTTTLATSATAGHLNSGSPITLTATVPTNPGLVEFFDGTTFLGSAPESAGSAAFTYSPADGSHSYTASFVPTVGDETNGGTNTAAVLGGSTSSAQAVSVTVPQTATSVSLAASATTIASGASDTFTATVSEADTTNAGVIGGTVQFFNGSSALGAPVTTTAGTGNTGTATLTTTSLPVGTDSITAVYTPPSSATSYSTSPASNAVVVTVSAPAACSLTGSSCSDTQNITVTVNPGTITIATPYTPSNPFALPAMTLSSDGTFLQSSATFPATGNPASQQIVVTSQLSPAYAWTVAVAATPLTSGANSIPASGLGLTNGALLNPAAPASGFYPGTVNFTGIPAHNPSPVDTDTNSGLGATPQTFAHSTAVDGTAVMDGTLTLYAATGTPAGTYSGTITFSVS